MKKILNSKFSYMVFVSIIALILASIDYLVVTFSTKNSFIPLLIGIVIFIGLFIYAFVFQKNQSKYNLFILLFIIVWSISLFYMGSIGRNVGDSWLTVVQDKITYVEFKFPGILEDVQYNYNSTTETVGSVVHKQFVGLDLNLIVSILMVIVSNIVLVLNYKKEEKQDVVESQPSNTIIQSPYFMMTMVSLLGLVLSTIESILLAISANAALIMMVVGSIIFFVIFIYILVSKKKNTPYNFLILIFILLWSLYTGRFLALCMTQSNNGKIYYRLGYIFPCLITRTGYDFITHIKLSTKVVYGYLNWLFSLGMLITSTIILYYKEKPLFQKFFKK